MDFPQVETEQAGLSILKQNGAINLLELNITSQMLIKIRCSSKKWTLNYDQRNHHSLISQQLW